MLGMIRTLLLFLTPRMILRRAKALTCSIMFETRDTPRSSPGL
jgi:hypothetical protein